MFLKRLIIALVALALLFAAYLWVALHWSYSEGERAGWLQKLSYKGWLCKTWEGELALVSLPGTATVEKFYFTVRDEAVAQKLKDAMGRRIALQYQEKVGLPTSCFGDTRYFVTGYSSPGGSAPFASPASPSAPGATPSTPAAASR